MGIGVVGQYFFDDRQAQASFLPLRRDASLKELSDIFRLFLGAIGQNEDEGVIILKIR